jgi:cytochrome c556
MQCGKILALGLAMVLMTCGMAAQASRAEDTIRYRKAVMVMIKWNYEQLSQQAKGSTPFSREEAQRQASWLDALSKSVLEGFPVGSHDGDTKALPAIWSQWPQFKTLTQRMQSDVTKLQELAQKGDVIALKAALNELTRTCKACHDDFKKS